MPNQDQEIGCWDSVLLEHLTEDSFIANLHHRYKRDHIYTYIGTFLIAINPFKPLPIYGPDQIQRYANKNLFKLPPHIYGVTNSAYQWLQDHNENQSIILSGESNSGKTETARLIVHYLSQVSGVRQQQNNDRINNSTTSPKSKTIVTSNLKSSLKSNSHIDISTASLSSSPKIVLPKSKFGLLKQCSIESAKSTLKKCTHEKTVDFDFLHYKSNENLPTTSAAAATASTSNKCQKHSCSNNAAPIRSVSVSPKQCLKHNSTSNPSTTIGLSTCLKKSSNCDQNVNTKIVEPHLVTCSKSFQTAPTTVSKQCQTVSNCDASSSTKSATIKLNCDRCGHVKCAKLNDTSTSLNKVLIRNEPSTSTIVKCNCDHSVAASKQCNTKQQSIGSISGVRTPPTIIRKKILKSASTTSCPPIERLSSISTVTPNPSPTISQSDSDMNLIRERIAQAEVFLEAIGHATTVHNYNSSRYGKFFDIKFDYKGDPIGAHLTHYMLEKSRVTTKISGERNFHIFYQLLSGADIQFLKSLKLQRNVDKYELLNHGNATEDDKNNFSYTKRSLETLGLTQDEILSIFKIIAVVIKLGNLVFMPTTNIDGTEGCHVSNEYELLETAQLLNLDAQILISCLTRTNNCNWTNIDNGTDLDALTANRIRNTICRTLYGRLFTWIIGRINDALKSKYCDRGKCLAILDFYGFENTDKNSFEQIVINYCNERLHQNCLQKILNYQQELYIREGLEWSRVDFFNNEKICELIDKPNYGILSLLDEPHITSDDTLLLRLQQCCAGHPDFLSIQGGGGNNSFRCFQIRHYAGPVTYSIEGFLEKNSDVLSRNISNGLYQSQLAIVQSLFPEGNPKRTVRKPTSIGATLRTQLQTLLTLNDNRKCHYVFCIKPNEHKQLRAFELPLVQHQVRYMSLMPLVALWRTGHCHHETHAKFLNRYKMLNCSTWPHFIGGSLVEGIAIIIRGLPLPAAEFTIGTKKVFIRSPRTVFELEEFRRLRLDDLALLIQKTYRCYSRRKYFLKLRNSQIIIASAWRTWRECRFGIPFKGQRHLVALYRVAREEYRIMKYRKQVEWAVSVIQRQYIQWKRRQFLYTLPLCLPSDSTSPLCVEWTIAPCFLAETSQLLYQIYHRWRCYKYRKTFNQTARNRMREKVTASIIFKDRKSSYSRSVGHPFLGDYVRLRQNVQWKKICVESNDQYVVFADIINKIARSSGKFVPILLVLSTSSMLLLDQRTLQIKYRVPATEIYRLSLSPYLDDIAVFHIKADYNNCSAQHTCSETTGCLFQSEMGRKKGDFVFQTGHVIEIVTKLFLVIQNATSKQPEVHISTDFEANFGQQTVVFTFKCLSGNNSSSASDIGQPKVTRKGNRMEIVV